MYSVGDSTLGLSLFAFFCVFLQTFLAKSICLWLVKISTVIIPVNKMGKRMDRYTGKCTRQGSMTDHGKCRVDVSVGLQCVASV